MRIRTLTPAALLLTLGANAGLAHEEHDGGKFIDYRTSVMQVLKWNMGPMGQMVKGEMAYDQAAFARYAKDLATAARLDVLAGFPEESDQGDTRALAEIWLDWEDFVKKNEALQRESAKLAEVAAGGDEGATREQFKAVGASCSGCHKKFRE